MAKRKKTLAELYVFNENQILSVMESITVHIKQLKSDLKYLNRKIAQANYINDPRNKTDETKDKIFTTTFERKECTLQDLIDIHIEKKHKISKLNNLHTHYQILNDKQRCLEENLDSPMKLIRAKELVTKLNRLILSWEHNGRKTYDDPRL